MKLPNGYGSIFKMGGKRRRPYRVVVTQGWELKDGRAVQKRATLGYFETKKEALDALAKYNDVPFSLARNTFGEVYKKWSEEHYPTISGTLSSGYANLFRWSSKLHDIPIRDIKVKDLEDVINGCTAESLKPKFKTFFGLVYKYAMKHDLCPRNLAEALTGQSQKNLKEHVPFTDDEIRKLFETPTGISALILIDIFSGWRPVELIDLKFEGGFMVGGAKTDAGKGRIVPVHSMIASLPYEPCDNYRTYHFRFREVMNSLGMEHTPYDARHTFATLCDRFHVKQNAIKEMMGHSQRDITERYTHRSKETLKEEIEKIKV